MIGREGEIDGDGIVVGNPLSQEEADVGHFLGVLDIYVEDVVGALEICDERLARHY